MYEILAQILRFVLVAFIYVFLYNIVKIMILELRGNIGNSEITNAKLEMQNIIYNLYTYTTLGRAEDNDIRIENQYVSSKHAAIYKRGRKFFLEDLKSTNGTFLNGKRIKKPVVLRNGDVIKVGEVELKFLLDKR